MSFSTTPFSPRGRACVRVPGLPTGRPPCDTQPMVDPSTGTRWPRTSSACMPTAVDTTRVSTSSTGRSASLGTRTTPCSTQDSSQARSAISCNGRTCRSTPHRSAVVIARLASVHRAVERTRSNSCALSMATAAAEPRVSTDARPGVGLSTGGAFMMSPACGCQQSVRLERLLSEAAADSWPHSGLAEILSIADVTRRSCDLHQRGDDPVGVGVMRAPHLAHAAAA